MWGSSTARRGDHPPGPGPRWSRRTGCTEPCTSGRPRPGRWPGRPGSRTASRPPAPAAPPRSRSRLRASCSVARNSRK
ncbi:hypothetical protein DMH18_16015 [Streptomyces sp. WAC 06783]|nr:hypothetical protein DMH18_16015 [Streptomyces sp. WAC 06783]